MGAEILCSSITAMEPIQLIQRVYFPAVNRPGREASHSPLFGAQIKNTWSCTSTYPYVLLTWCLIKHKGVLLREHRRNFQQGLLEKSKLAQHVYEEGHRSSWDDARILEIESNSRYRKYKKSVRMACLTNPISITQFGHFSHLDPPHR
jgi:hypothetical protein